MSASFDIDDADHVTVGALGEPGHRVFYLQAGPYTLKVEKQQVTVLAQALSELLSDLPSPGEIPAAPELAGFAEPDWIVGGMQLAYDQDDDRVVIVAEELVTEEGGDAATGRVRMTRQQAAALIARSEELVEAGRPPCPWCGYPLDPAGHSCPRTNGHRPPTL